MSITGIAYLLIYISGLLLSLSGRVRFGLYTYFFAFYAYAPGRWWGEGLPSLRWSLIAGIVTLVSVFMHNKSKTDWLKRTEVRLFLVFVIWVWIQNIWALSSSLHFEYSVMVTKFLLLIYLIHAVIKTERQLFELFVINLMGCAYYGWIGYTQTQGGRFENAGTPGMEDGNLLSLHMATVLIFASYILLCNFGKKKYLLIPFIVLVLNGIFLTQSRGTLVAIVVSALVSLFFVPASVKREYRVYVILAFIGGISLLGPVLLERINSTVGSDDTEIEESAYSRIVIINAQLEMFSEKPLIGNGHRGTQMLSPYYVDEEYMTGKAGNRRRGSHNLLMTLFIDHGVIGATIFLAMVISLFRRFFKLRPFLMANGDKPIVLAYIGLNISLICFWVASMSVNSIRLEVGVWCYALIGLALSWIAKQYPEAFIKNNNYRQY